MTKEKPKLPKDKMMAFAVDELQRRKIKTRAEAEGMTASQFIRKVVLRALES